MSFTIKDIVKATDAKIIIANEDFEEFDISTDTRTIGVGMLYLPLKGERFNGFDFIQDALIKGANGYFTESLEDINLDADIILQVEDTKTAYLRLAEFYRDKINPKVILITGSSGKTTVKEMMAATLQEKYKTHKTKLNHNNEIGLCQTLLSMPKDTEVLVVEGGMRGLGEIELISEYTKPDFGIITNVGTAHIGRLGSRENIAKAKCEITSYMKPEGILIAPDDKIIKENNGYLGETVYVNFNNIQKLKQTSDGSEFLYGGNKYYINQEGEHNIQNACLVIETALAAGMSSEEISEGLKKSKPMEKRWNLQEVGRFKVINDCYNSNPDSVKAAVKTFLELYNGIKILVLGDMGELGNKAEMYHEQTGDFIDNYDYDCLLTYGELSKNINPVKGKTIHFEDKKLLSEYINDNYKESAYILLKASRSMKFEEIIEELEKICH